MMMVMMMMVMMMVMVIIIIMMRMRDFAETIQECQVLGKSAESNLYSKCFMQRKYTCAK
jgi:hypothetical protein